VGLSGSPEREGGRAGRGVGQYPRDLRSLAWPNVLRKSQVRQVQAQPSVKRRPKKGSFAAGAK